MTTQIKKEIRIKNLSLYQVHTEFFEPILGTCAGNPTVYADYIAALRFKNEKKVATTPEELAAIEVKEIELTKEELAMLPEEDKGITVFRRSENGGLILLDHMLRGFMKAAAEAVGDRHLESWGLTQKVDRWIFVTDETGRPIRQIPLMRDGSQIMAPDDKCERPLRAKTPQGPRVTLASSEQVNAPAYVDYHLVVLPLAETERHGLKADTLESWLDYGVFSGIGQWRNAGYGRFDTQLTKLPRLNESAEQIEAAEAAVAKKAAAKLAKKAKAAEAA